MKILPLLFSIMEFIIICWLLFVYIVITEMNLCSWKSYLFFSCVEIYWVFLINMNLWNSYHFYLLSLMELTVPCGGALPARRSVRSITPRETFPNWSSVCDKWLPHDDCTNGKISKYYQVHFIILFMVVMVVLFSYFQNYYSELSWVVFFVFHCTCHNSLTD